jgi:hypothetical protein
MLVAETGHRHPKEFEMHCPFCSATTTIRYGSVPGGHRRTAISRCPSCQATMEPGRSSGAFCSLAGH